LTERLAESRELDIGISQNRAQGRHFFVRGWNSVNKGELNDLIPLAYEELRRVARQRLDRLKPGGTLSPTDLVNEVLLRLLNQDVREYHGTDHLIRTAAQAMHNVLVDRARRRVAAKRGGGAIPKRIDFDDDLPSPPRRKICSASAKRARSCASDRKITTNYCSCGSTQA